MSQDRIDVTGNDLMDVMTALNSPEYRMDPYPYYRRLREQAPFYHTPNRWLLARFQDCDALLRDDLWERVEEKMCLPDKAVCSLDPGAARMQPGIDIRHRLVLDPERSPSRIRMRKLFADTFSPIAVRRLQPRIEAFADELLDAALQASEVDLVEAFALPLPTLTVCELLGVPVARRAVVREWVYGIVRAADPVFSMSAEDLALSQRADREVSDYFRHLIAERRRRPREDLLSNMANREVYRQKLSDEELIAACVMLFVAGQEMIANLIGLGALALLRNPDQLQRWRNDPSIGASAVEELLRYDSPAQMVPRVALQDRELDGHRVPPGDFAVVLLGAANRDPEAFHDPDQLDLSRQPNRHLSFSQGHLYCPGAPLARLQARLAFNALLRRAPALELNGEPLRKGTFCVRGLAGLPVTLR